MEDALILETSFLIDLEREQRAARAAKRKARAATPAHDFLSARPDAHLSITIVTVGELAAGIAPDERGRLDALIGGFATLLLDSDVCWEYGRAYRYLAGQGLLIGTNDLWIAATAIARQQPLVTRDVRHFSRVPGLHTLAYVI